MGLPVSYPTQVLGGTIFSVTIMFSVTLTDTSGACTAIRVAIGRSAAMMNPYPSASWENRKEEYLSFLKLAF